MRLRLSVSVCQCSSGSVNAGECVSAIEPKDTFDGSVQGKSACEDNISKGLVDGRVEGRTGVHMEREAVLKSERYDNEGAFDMLCLM